MMEEFWSEGLAAQNWPSHWCYSVTKISSMCLVWNQASTVSETHILVLFLCALIRNGSKHHPRTVVNLRHLDASETHRCTGTHCNSVHTCTHCSRTFEHIQIHSLSRVCVLLPKNPIISRKTQSTMFSLVFARKTVHCPGTLTGNKYWTRPTTRTHLHGWGGTGSRLVEGLMKMSFWLSFSVK